MNPISKLTAQLDPDEKILWSERPGIISPRSAQAIIGAVIVFALVAGAWILPAAFRTHVAIVFGASLAISVWQRSRTLYAVTSKRPVIVRPSILGTDTQSFHPFQVRFLRCRKRSDGSGSIVFSEIPGHRSGTVELGFEYVVDVSKVERLIRELCAAAPKASTTQRKTA